MEGLRPGTDPRYPPSAFDEVVDWLEGWSYGLVLLEDYPLADLRDAISTVDSAVRAHRRETESWVVQLVDADEATSRTARVVLHDHTWFGTSIEQFRWFFRVVEGDDHGGHRQALGQYGRVLAEALRRHRRDERWLEARRSPPLRDPVP